MPILPSLATHTVPARACAVWRPGAALRVPWRRPVPGAWRALLRLLPERRRQRVAPRTQLLRSRAGAWHQASPLLHPLQAFRSSSQASAVASCKQVAEGTVLCVQGTMGKA